MTRIDFYQIAGDELTFTCRLIDKVYRRGLKIYVHATSESQAQQLDAHLWTFRPDSFVPHVLNNNQSNPDTDVPVKIGFDHEPDEHQEVLINLSGDIPHFFSRFDRVAEVVPVDQNSRDAARKNYTYYKERGYPLHYHQVN
ncbi:MAG: DNA polymerase-3 subunit chi [Candidatus Azotimanducaceae bacterium]